MNKKEKITKIIVITSNLEFDEEWIERAIATEAIVHNKIKIENQKIGIELLTNEELKVIREALYEKTDILKVIIKHHKEWKKFKEEIKENEKVIDEIKKIFEKIG